MNGATHLCPCMEAMPHIFRVTVAETMTIPAMSEMVVPGKIDDTAPFTQGIFESGGQQLCGGNVTLARVVVNPAEEILPLHVMNMSSEPQTLYRDTHVATCEPVASVGVPLSSEKANLQPVDVDKLQLPEHVQQMIDECQRYRCHNQYVEWIKQSLQDSYERAKHHLQAVSKRQKQYYDVRTKDRQYCEGDFVLRFYLSNLKSKLNSPYIGPFRVMTKLGNVTYKIQRTPQSKPMVVHMDHLKIFHTDAPPEAWSSPEIDVPYVLLEGDSPEVGDTDGCDEDVSVDAKSSVGHTPESNAEPSILEKESGATPPAQQFPRRSSRKGCLPFHLCDYDMAQTHPKQNVVMYMRCWHVLTYSCHCFQEAMKPGRECTTCGKMFANRYKLYRHTIHVHNRRFCWFCDHEEVRPRRLRRHVQKHPGVAVDTMTNEELLRSVEDAIIHAPEAMIVVPVSVALPPEAEVEIGEVVAEVELGEVLAEVELREVAVDAVVDETSAAEAVVDELSVVGTVKEVETEEVAAEEVVTDESSGSWREVEEIDISEPLAVVCQQVIRVQKIVVPGSSVSRNTGVCSQRRDKLGLLH